MLVSDTIIFLDYSIKIRLYIHGIRVKYISYKHTIITKLDK